MFQSVLLWTVSLVVISSFRAHSCVSWTPHLPAAVVSNDDGQKGYGCFGSRPSSCVLKNTSQIEIRRINDGWVHGWFN